MSNHEKFKETFEQISMSEDKLQDIENLEIRTQKRAVRKPVIVFAFACMCILVILLGKTEPDSDTGYQIVTGKITYYAAEGTVDGESRQELMEDGKERFVLKKEHVMVNNDKLSDVVTDAYVDENGLTCYEMSDGSVSGMVIEEPEHTSIFIYEIRYEEGGGQGGIVAFCGNLRKINDRIYLYFTSYEEGIDITEDFSDGVAVGKMKWSTGTLEKRLEETFEYRVEGTLEDYTVDVWWIEGE